MAEKDRACPECGTLLAERDFRPVSVEGQHAELTLKECPACSVLATDEAPPPIDQPAGAEGGEGGEGGARPRPEGAR